MYFAGPFTESSLLLLFCRKYLVTVQTQADRVKLFDLDRYWFNPHIQITAKKTQ